MELGLNKNITSCFEYVHHTYLLIHILHIHMHVYMYEYVLIYIHVYIYIIYICMHIDPM